MSELEDIPSEFYEMTGRITCDWAILEILVNDCIWALSGIHYGAGACITSQIYTFDGRMKGLIALLNLRKANDFAKKVNLFWEGSRKASETRNRVAHDPFFSEKGEAWQLSITANKLLKIERSKKDIKDLRNDQKLVERKLLEFVVIYEELRALLPSLPGTLQLTLLATVQPHSPK
jgi:hypothetical protein